MPTKQLNDYIYYQDEFITLYNGDVREILPLLDASIVQTTVSSPPYFGLRSYLNADHESKSKEIGSEATPKAFVDAMVEVFEDVRRVTRAKGTLWMNLGDSYASDWPCSRRSKIGSGSLENGKRENRAPRLGGTLKPKDLMMMPARTAIALCDAGWWLRSDIPWVKRSAMPESVVDRPAKALEYVYLLSKAQKPFVDMAAIRLGMAQSSIERLSQDTANQIGSDRVPGKTNGNMKAVGNRDRSLPNNRNGENGNLDATPAGSRNFRNADMWFQSITPPHGLVGIGDEIVGIDVNPSGFKESHFATFPQRLIIPFIKAGTSEHGQCVECGSPWKRIVEHPGNPKGILGRAGEPNSRTRSGGFDEVGIATDSGKRLLERGHTATQYSKAVYKGWSKSCKCKTDEVEPQIVLDPFAGAGTTLIVAKNLGRRSIGIELNPEYCEMIVRRIKSQTILPADDRGMIEVGVKEDTELPLFDEIG